MVSKKVKKKKKNSLFLIGKIRTWYWGKRWLFSIGNRAVIRPLEMDRKSPVSSALVRVFPASSHKVGMYMKARAKVMATS